MIAIPLIVLLILLRSPMEPNGVRVSMICGGIVFALLVWLAEWMYVSVHFSQTVNACYLAGTAAGVVIIGLVHFRRKAPRSSKNPNEH